MNLVPYIFLFVVYILGCVFCFEYPQAAQLSKSKRMWQLFSLTSWLGIVVCLIHQIILTVRSSEQDNRWDS